MTEPEKLTLQNVREQIKVKNFRASDFLTKEQTEEVKKTNLKGKERGFNQVDAYIAEIIGRFGYDTYKAWKLGEISEKDMLRYIKAERAREAGTLLGLETIIFASMAGANHPTKSGHSPQSLKTAIKILQKEEQKAKGDF